MKTVKRSTEDGTETYYNTGDIEVPRYTIQLGYSAQEAAAELGGRVALPRDSWDGAIAEIHCGSNSWVVIPK